MSTATRRAFMQTVGGASLSLAGCAVAADKPAAPEIAGFDDRGREQPAGVWRPVSDRRLRVGLVGYGVCRFAAQFSFQTHPNVEVAAVSDLIPDRCAELARVTGCQKTYPSLEEMVKDETIEAIFVATDAPSHARQCIEVLNHGKHVCSAVPACFETVEEGEELLAAVERTGLCYMMFETSSYRDDCYAMRQAYGRGAFGRLVYTEGEYYHFFGDEEIGSYNGWRDGLPPMWYPTHSTAYYVTVTGGTFTRVSCLGFRGGFKQFQAENNRYRNPFDSEIALFQTSEGGMARIAVCWGLHGMHGEVGRVGGEHGGMVGTRYSGQRADQLGDLARPALPPGVDGGGHGGSHGRLTDEFVSAILAERRPLVDIYDALNMTVPGIIAHQSALRDGEWLAIPQYHRPDA